MANDRFTFNSAGQVHELEMALDRAGGYNSALVKRMCEGDRLTHIREYLLGLAEIKYPEYLINCDADPFVPDGWHGVEEHIKGGQFKWNHAEVKPFLSDHQRDDKVIGGHDLRKELAGKLVLNANVLDYLLAHQYLIPEEWKGKYIAFWGTIYCGRLGRLCVRCLCWLGVRWHWACGWLDDDWDGRDPAACSVPGVSQSGDLRASLPA